MILAWMTLGTSAAQDAVRLTERVTVGEEAVEQLWPQEVPKPGMHAQWQSLLEAWYQSRAWFGARIEEVRSSGDTLFVQVRTGPQIPWAGLEVVLEGGLRFDASDIEDDWVGQPASEKNLQAIVASILGRMTRAGFLGARVAIASMTDGPSGMVVRFQVETGPPIRLGGVRLEGDERTRAAALWRTTDLREGQSLEGVSLVMVRDRLAATGWFDQVGEPSFELSGDSLANLVIPVRRASPGRFDVSIGSLPAASGTRSRWVGSGHLALNNAFGAGRTVEMRVNRLPDQASSAMLAFETPAPRDWPVLLDGRFEGYQQDSTFNRTQMRSGVQLQLDAFTRLGGSFSWERTRAGQAGGQILGGQVRIPESAARYAGLTFRYRRMDSGGQPRRGILLATRLERGSRTIRTREVVDLDTLAIRRNEPRERLAMEMNWLGANRGAFGLALGAEAQLVRVRRADESELIPLGGATSLRGYDEDRFRGTGVGRAWLEARWYLDTASRAFAFYDAGWVALQADNRQQLSGALRSATGFHPGYGIGFVFSTAAGPVSLSWAVNPEEQLRNGRIHLSLSFGL